MRADHLLHFTPDRYGGEWRLECLTESAPGEHFTVDAEEWFGTADEAEADGLSVDRDTCWVHDWMDAAGSPEEWMVGDGWTEDGPWPVACSFDGGHMDVEFVVQQRDDLYTRLQDQATTEEDS